MEKIDISASFREAMRFDGKHGVDEELVTEGLGSALARFADKAVGGLFAKNITNARRKMDSWTSSFKEAMGDISHTIRRDIEKIAKFGDNQGKWSAVVAGDLTQHVTKGLTGKGGMPANFKVATVTLPNGRKANDIPLAWAICAQSSLFDMVNNQSEKLPRLSELLGTVANTINIAAYIAAAKQYGQAPYNDIASYIASGAGGELSPATEYNEDKDELFKESVVALFQNGWRPANMQAMAGMINLMCSQYYIQSFAFMADNKIVAFTEQWYEANKHLWGWQNDTEPQSEPGQDFDEQVRSKLIKSNTAKNTGPMTNPKIAVAIVPALVEKIDGGDQLTPKGVTDLIGGMVKEFQSAKTKTAFTELKKDAEAIEKLAPVGESVISEREGEEGADSGEADDFGNEDDAFADNGNDNGGEKKNDAAPAEQSEYGKKFEEFKGKLGEFFKLIGLDAENKEIAKVVNNDEDAVNEWKEGVGKVNAWVKDWKAPEPQKKDNGGENGKKDGDSAGNDADTSVKAGDIDGSGTQQPTSGSDDGEVA